MQSSESPYAVRAVLEAVASHAAGRPALVAADEMYTFGDLRLAATHVAAAILRARENPAGERIAIMTQPAPQYVAALLGTWMVGGIAVPIRPGVPRPEIDRLVEDAGPSVVLHDDANAHSLLHLSADVRIRQIPVGMATSKHAPPLPAPPPDAAALMIYTSGTTGPPKGVVHTHASLAAQVASLRQAWAWTPDDRILLVLPLHHIHGIVNVLCTALVTGATVDMHGAFDAVAVWEAFARGKSTLFMAVPTIYGQLLRTWENGSADDRSRWSEGASRLRLMVSGSAALPVDMLERWEQVTGQRLLERYGMSEVGMALSNTLDERVAGTVGFPLPGVRARLLDDDGRVLDGDVDGGRLQLQGPTLFREYWRQPDATRNSFVNGWFDTGDNAARLQGRYRLLGRSSVDILKTGGEKVSALEIEFAYRNHDGVEDIAVVGVDDPVWGQRVCAAVVPAAGHLDPDTLRGWGKQHLVEYKVPREFLVVEDLPRNAMGKVEKPRVAALFGAARVT